MLYLYNTLSGKKEKFIPQTSEKVSLYVCGPTVYNFAHIGNARPAIVFDVLYRFLQIYFPKVVYARNITDIDDKIIERSKQERVSCSEITRRYTLAFHEDLDALGCLSPDYEPKVTDHLPAILEMIKILLQKKCAYIYKEHVFFDITRFSSYGCLSNRRDNQDFLVDPKKSAFKRNRHDFVLWKPSVAGEPGWESPWGMGRPGWHIECSAMIQHFFGEQIDIHGGGLDLLFPHNENERAQSMCSHNMKELALFWMHNGFITISGSKMSKSAGNIILLHELRKRISPVAIRWIMLSVHYRNPLDWQESLFAQAQANLTRYYHCLRNIIRVLGRMDSPPSFQKLEKKDFPKVFLAALEDDLNTPQAIREFFSLITQINREIDRHTQPTNSETEQKRNPSTKAVLEQSARQLLCCACVLGLPTAIAEDWLHPEKKQAKPTCLKSFGKKSTEDTENQDETEDEKKVKKTKDTVQFGDGAAKDLSKIEELISLRNQLRQEKKYAQADKIREQLNQMGVQLEDRQSETEWIRKY